MQGVYHSWVGWVGHVGVGESYRGGVEWVIQECGGSCRGWVGSCRGGMGWIMQGWGGSCRGGVGWVMQGRGGSCRDGMGSHLSDCKIMNFCAINF